MVTIPAWLRISSADTRLVIESIVQETVTALAATQGRGHSQTFDEVRDRLLQLRLLFDWADRQVNLEKQAEAGEKEDRDARSLTAHQQREKGGIEGGLWLNYDIVEKARWKIWGIQLRNLHD